MHLGNATFKKNAAGGGLTNRVGNRSTFNSAGGNDLTAMAPNKKAWHNADGAATPAATVAPAAPMTMASFGWLIPFAAGIILTLTYKHFTKKS